MKGYTALFLENSRSRAGLTVLRMAKSGGVVEQDLAFRKAVVQRQISALFSAPKMNISIFHEPYI